MTTPQPDQPGIGRVKIAGRLWRWRLADEAFPHGDVIEVDWAGCSIAIAPGLGTTGTAEVLAMAIEIITDRCRVGVITTADRDYDAFDLFADVPHDLLGLELVASLQPLPFVEPVIVTDEGIHFSRLADARRVAEKVATALNKD
ncbi:MAG: hypothetical protein AAF916_07015 [Planctomycetota bacterium]